MDIQFIGEKSCALSSYITKYQTKPEKSYAVQSFEVINNTKSLSSKLWNVALRSLNNRECGALEASDTLLEIPLYGTDKNTTIKWLDVSTNRNRRLKSKEEIEKLLHWWILITQADHLKWKILIYLILLVSMILLKKNIKQRTQVL